MQKDLDHNLYCPKCNKRAKTAMPGFRNFSRRLDLPIFLCHECKTIDINKSIIRSLIKSWKQSLLTKMPLKQLCKEFIEKLEKWISCYWVAQLGYKKTYFKKMPQK